jgi:regulator of protease activity HflC (stomatin/prohibitin superfamily)
MAANLTAMVIVLVVVVALSLLAASIRVVKQYERGVHFRLGRIIAVREPVYVPTTLGGRRR